MGSGSLAGKRNPQKTRSSYSEKYMTKFYLTVLLLLSLHATGQTQLYLQRISDTTKLRPLKLNKLYGVSAKNIRYKYLRLTAVSDTLLVFSTRGKPKELIPVPLTELRYLDATPVFVHQMAGAGYVGLVLSQIPLLASPFIGLLDNWQKAGTAVKFSGLLVGGGLLLISPVLLFSRYQIGEKWRIISIDNQKHAHRH
jgi:hypothetical protein